MYKNLRNYLTPWLTIWFRPVETIDRLLNTKHCKFILFFIFSISSLVEFGQYSFLYSIGSPFTAETGSFFSEHLFIGALLIFSLMSLSYAIMLALIILLLFWIARVFKGKANYKEILVATILSIVPNIVSSVLGHLDRFGDTLSIGFSWWGLILFIIMFSHIEKFSKWKTLVVFAIIIGLIMYTSYELSEDEASSFSDSSPIVT